MKKNKILVIGSSGQIGTDLCLSLERIYGTENIICSDLNPPKEKINNKKFLKLDVLDNEMLTRKVKEENISESSSASQDQINVNVESSDGDNDKIDAEELKHTIEFQVRSVC